MKKFNNKIHKFLLNITKLIRKPVMSILPGQLSFFLLLSLIPIILIIGIIASSLSVSTNDIVNSIENGLPADTSAIIVPLISGKGVDYNIIILIVSALILASKGTRSMVRVAAIIYDEKDNMTIKIFIKSIVLAILLVLLFAFLIIIPVLGPKILKMLDTFKMVSNVPVKLILLYNIFKWPITFLILFINLKIIYLYSPNQKIPSNSVNQGSLFTTILWVVSTYLYSFYINNLTKYNIFYGSASNIIILMLWIYLISYIFVLGMSINASSLKIQDDLQ